MFVTMTHSLFKSRLKTTCQLYLLYIRKYQVGIDQWRYVLSLYIVVIVTVSFPYCPLYYCTRSNNCSKIILGVPSCGMVFMYISKSFFYFKLKLKGSNNCYLIFDCILADRGSVRDNVRT